MSAGQTPDEVLRSSARFRKSTRSSGSQDCVAVGQDPGLGLAGFQDTKEHEQQEQRTTLAVDPRAFAAFLAGVKAGRYDR